MVRVQQGEFKEEEERIVEIEKEKRKVRLRGQAVKTSPFHGGNTGSIPVGVIKNINKVLTDLYSWYIVRQ